jgi:hypothetical protein
MFQKINRIAGLFALLFIMGTLNFALAQGQLGTISGTVTDAQGAVVAGATVEATNIATGDKRTATTSDNGNYSLPNLTVALYNVTVNASGFAPSTVKDVKVSVAFNTTQDFALNPAGASETVVVSTGDAQTQINTTDQQLSTLLDNKKIIDLPLLSRSPDSLILLSPGTVQTTSRLGGFAVNGQRERNNNFLVDGVDNNDTDVPGIPGGIATPNIDATQEFRVITGNFNAEYGRNTGAIVTIATKNGTNEFHGGAYIYYRSDAFSARNFFDQSGSPDQLQRKQFGASIGGPIKRDRTFFFFNYEGDRFVQGSQQTRTVPSASARLGILNTGAANFGTLDISNLGANNEYGLPINTAIQRIINAIYPLGNSPGSGPLPGVFDEFRFQFNSRQTQNSIATRIDHRINDKHNLTGSFNYNKAEFPLFADTFPGFNDGGNSPQKAYLLSLNLLSNFTPNLINELRFGGNRSLSRFNGPGDGTASTAIFDRIRAEFVTGGIPTNIAPFGGANGQIINISGGTISGLGAFDTQFRTTGTTVLADNLTMVKGNHTFKGGFEARFVYSNGASNFFRNESLNFSVPTTFGFPIVLDNQGNELPTTGAGALVQNYASLLYGFLAIQSQSQFFNKNGERVDADYRGYRTRETDFFFQDTWRVRPNFTLNYGLRYELKGVPYEVNGQMSTLVNQDPSGPTPPGGFVFQLVGKNSPNPGQSLYNSDYNNFAPRFGFNYSPGWENGFIGALTGGPGKTTIRGGYGVFYDRVFGNLFSNSSANPPFQRDFANFPGDFVELIPRPTTLDPSPVVVDGDELAPVLFALPGNNQFQSKFANPYTQSWNFGIQRELGNAFLFEADYVGSHGVNLLRSIDGNMTSVARVNAIRAAQGLPPRAISTSLRTNYLRGSQNTAFNTAITNLAVGQSTFNSMQLRVTKTLTNKSLGLGQIQGVYTWSHSIDDANDPIDPSSNDRSLPRDSSGFAGGWRAERGDSTFDVRHRFVLNFIYELPFSSENKFADLLIGDWSLSGIAQAQSGSPYSVFANGVDSQGTGLSARARFATAQGGLPPTPAEQQNPRVQTGPGRELFLGVPCTATVTTRCIPLDGQQGNVPPRSFVGPAFSTVDISLIKRIPVSERYRFTIRADFFNIFNRVNLNQPINNVNDLRFGQSTEAGDPRIIQFVGRFDF